MMGYRLTAGTNPGLLSAPAMEGPIEAWFYPVLRPRETFASFLDR